MQVFIIWSCWEKVVKIGLVREQCKDKITCTNKSQHSLYVVTSPSRLFWGWKPSVWFTISRPSIFTFLMQNHIFLHYALLQSVLSFFPLFPDCHWFSGPLSLLFLTSTYLMLSLIQFRWQWKPADIIIWILGRCG